MDPHEWLQSIGSSRLNAWSMWRPNTNDSSARPQTEKSRFSLTKLGNVGQNLDFRGPEIEAHRSVSKFPNLELFRPNSSIIFNYFDFSASPLSSGMVENPVKNLERSPPWKSKKTFRNQTKQRKSIERQRKTKEIHTKTIEKRERAPLGPNPLSFL